jgi:hypothetical protein
MSALIWASPAPLAPQTGHRPNLKHTWTDSDGYVWALNRSAGVWLHRDGIRGMNMPTVTRYTTTSPAVHGSRNRGWIVEEREVFWPLMIAPARTIPDGEEWRASFDELDSRFWRTLNPDATGTWTVKKPNGESRDLVCRFKDDGGHQTAGPAFALQFAAYGITMVAEQPFWLGAPEVRSFGASGPDVMFFGGGSAGGAMAFPPIAFKNASSYGTAAINNDGDVEAWPVWANDGASTSASVGVGDNIIQIPFPVPAGKRLVIDTDPQAQTALLGDPILLPDGRPDPDRLTELTGPVSDRTKDLGSVTWSPVPARAEVALNIETIGGGSIACRIRPRYMRAW